MNDEFKDDNIEQQSSSTSSDEDVYADVVSVVSTRGHRVAFSHKQPSSTR